MSLESIRMWLRALFQRSRVEREMEKEMLLHIEMAIEASIRRGMSPEEARRSVAIAFGGVERHKEGVRDERFTRGIEELLRDFGHALRMLRKRPGFTALATLTLAVGIGATAGVFTFANWILLRPVPGIAAPDELVVVSFEDGPGQPTGFSFAMLTEVSRSVEAFGGVMGTRTTSVQLSGDGVAARDVQGAIVGGGYFDVLGIRPARGRFFTADELEATSTAPVAVISWALWRSQFAMDTAILGRTVRFNANDFTIVGVAPRRFHGIERIGLVDAWFPAGVYSALRHMPLDASKPDTRVLGLMVARLKPGTSMHLAQQQLSAVVGGLLKTDPQAFGIHESHPPVVYDDIGTELFGRGRMQQTMRLLFAIVAIVLVIACANVANLLLLRGLARRPEFAVRKALGASAFQLLRLHTTEGLVIGLAGGTIGVAVTLLIAKLFEDRQFAMSHDAAQVSMDARVVGFVFLLALLTGMLFGLVPGLATIRDRANVALADAGRRSTGVGGRLRAGLMVVQVLGAVALISMALLLNRTMTALRRVELGFDPANVTIMKINPAPQGYSAERLRALRTQMLAAVGAEQGVEAVSLATVGVPQRAYHVADVRPADMATDRWPYDARMSPVSADYFATLRIPRIAGRAFDDADELVSVGAPVIINATAARTLFAGRNPIGAEVLRREWQGTKRHRIVGVVGDAQAADLRKPQGSVLYVPMSEATTSDFDVVIRSSRPLRDLETVLRRVVSETDPSIPADRVSTMETFIESSMRQERMFLRLVGLLGALAISLAAVGLYGVTAFSVAQRRREIGIRIALGAGVRAVIKTVTRQAAGIVTAGVILGLLAAAAFARALESMLFGVEPLDARSYAGAAILFAAVAIIACIIPARSAALVDPTEALRAE